MMGTRVSLSVGLLASVLVLLIGSVYGSVAGFLGGKVDLFMMRIVDIIYTVPDLLIIILLAINRERAEDNSPCVRFNLCILASSSCSKLICV